MQTLIKRKKLIWLLIPLIIYFILWIIGYNPYYFVNPKAGVKNAILHDKNNELSERYYEFEIIGSEFDISEDNIQYKVIARFQVEFPREFEDDNRRNIASLSNTYHVSKKRFEIWYKGI